MSLSVADFINGRCAEHDFIRNSWRSLQRTMTMSELRRMQRLIEQPGFCVKKFEETYLLKRLNPFAQNEEQRHISFSHLDCECGKAQNARDITAMKNQMSQFLEKWEDMMYQWQNDQPESYASDDYYEDDDLRQNTSASMEDDEVQPSSEREVTEMQKPADVQKPVDVQKSAEAQKPAEVQKLVDAQKHEVEKQHHKPGSAVAEQCLWNVAHVSGQPTHLKNVVETQIENKNTPSTSSIKTSDVANPSKTTEPGTVIGKEEKETTKAPKMEETPKTTSFKTEKVLSTKLTETKKEIGSESVKATDLQIVVPAKPDIMKDVVAATNIQKTSAEPETAKTNTAPSLPATLSQEEPISVACTEETASLPSPLTQDGISPAITDNSRTAGSPDSGMISDISEFKNMDSEKNESEAAKETDPAKMTGRDGRRYRKKLEAERLAAEQSKLEEKSEEASTRASTESVGAESEEAVMSGKEKRRLKDKIRKEKKEQEKLEEAKKKKEEKEKEAALQTKAKETFEDSSLTEPSVEAEPSEAGTTPPSTSTPDNEAIAGPGLGAIDLVQEGTSEALSVDSNAPNMESYSEVAEEGAEEGAEEQPKKLSKSQKKRAFKKAKGVYVVNENKKGHSVELLPGEYKIVKLDQSPRKADASESGDGQVAVPGVEGSPNQQNKKVNFYVAGNLSKDILDNGKWLAYVIDDKNPDGTPRIGEVDTEEVEKTIRLLDSQLAHAEQPVVPFIDDFDYNSLMSDREAEQFVSQIVPELDPDHIRSVLEKPGQALASAAGAGESLCPIETMMDDYLPDMTPDDLENYMNYDPNNVVFKTEFARRTAPLFVGNNQFKEFCIKYSKSKFNPKTIHTLIKKYIDARIVFHYERFKKFADYEARHISARWTQVSENSPYALMVMLFINNKESSVNFADIEKVLFPET